MERLSLDRMRTGFTVRVEDSWWHWPNIRPPQIARTIEEVAHLLAQIEAHPHWSALVLTYDSAPAFDPAFVVQSNPSRPWLALAYLFNQDPEIYSRLEPPPLSARVPVFEPSIDREAYDRMFHEVRAKLAGGDTYQVNATFPLRTTSPAPAGEVGKRSEPGGGRPPTSSAQTTSPAPAGEVGKQSEPGGGHPPTNSAQTTSPAPAGEVGEQSEPGGGPGAFALLCGDAPPPYAAYFPTPDGTVASLSPELFFEKRGTQIHSRPMKGTRPRHADPQEMVANQKDRAENLMIVDMIRNDLGRIAKTGSVHVPKLFELEDHGTVWQMTSTVAAETDATLTEALGALFPCASVVGAPKVETTRIIAEVESAPRGLYTGAIGITKPGFARFSVAIRTLEQDTYGVGSGLVWDSKADEEWAECLAKAEILKPYGDELRLLETLRWEPETGYLFLEDHLDRLRNSAHAFEIPVDEAQIREALNQTWPQPQRIRLLVGRTVEVRASPLNHKFNPKPEEASEIEAQLSPVRIDSQNPWLRHKTTNRRLYELAKPPTAEDAILVNEQNQPTEFTIGNLVIKKDDTYLTPPIGAGILPGVYRNHLLTNGIIQESPLTLHDLQTAGAIFRINSVRGWERVRFLTIPS